MVYYEKHAKIAQLVPRTDFDAHMWSETLKSSTVREIWQTNEKWTDVFLVVWDIQFV